MAVPKELNPNWQPSNISAQARQGIRSKAINRLKAFALIYVITARALWEQGHKKYWFALRRASIEVTIVLPPYAKKWDSTNMRAALKPMEDGLTPPNSFKSGADIIADDGPECLTWQDIKWQRGNEAEIVVVIKERLT